MAKSTLEIVINGVTSGADRAFDKVGVALRSLGKAAIAAAAIGLAAVGAGLALSIKEAMEAQVVQAQLAAVLKSTGGAAGVTADMANNLATSLSKVTRFGDEAILSGENMLLTFTNIGKDVFPAATQTILDMSTALGQDLQSSALQLGKALNNPIEGMSALQRVGVTFTEEQKKVIEALMATGDIAGAQKVILAELAKEFGGSAEAAGKTFAGQLDILKNTLLNVAEGIGTYLIPYLEIATKWLSANLPKAIEKVKAYWEGVLLPAIKKVWSWLSTVLIPFLMATIPPAFEAVKKAIIPVIDAFRWLFDVIKENGLTALITQFEDGSSYVGAFFEKLGFGEEVSQRVAWAMIDIAKAVRGAIEAVRTFVVDHVIPFVKEHGKLITDILVGIGVAFAAFAIISTVVGWIAGLISAFASLGAIISASGGIIATIVAVLGGPLTIIIGLVSAAIGLLYVAWQNNWGGIREKTAAAWAVIQPLLQAAWDWLKVNIPAALEAMRKYWVEVAWPAILKVVQAVWPVILTIFTAIKDFIFKDLIPAVKELYTKWTTVWWPTIQTVLQNVWTVISAIFTELGRWINVNIIPWVEYLKKVWSDTVWPAIQKAVEDVWRIIQPIWEAIRAWMEDKLPPATTKIKEAFATAMTAIDKAIQPVKDLWDGFAGAVQKFWDWISSKTFTFKIKLPDLPAWAIPSSPLPIHTAWKAFYKDMQNMQNMMSLRAPANMSSLEQAGSSTRFAVYGGMHLYGVENRDSLLAQLSELSI